MLVRLGMPERDSKFRRLQLSVKNGCEAKRTSTVPEASPRPCRVPTVSGAWHIAVMLPMLLAGASIFGWFLLARRRPAGGGQEAEEVEAHRPRANGRADHAPVDAGTPACTPPVALPPGAVPPVAAPPLVHPHAHVIEQLSKQPPPLQLPARPQHQTSTPPGVLGNSKAEYAWVDTAPKLAAACMELFEQDRIALDVEHHSLHTYAGMTCLVQLSTGEWQAQGGDGAGQGAAAGLR